MALLRFKQTYRRAGLELDDDELPDHLCRACWSSPPPSTRRRRGTCCSTTAPGSSCCGWRCATAGSPWAAVVEAVCATLPPLRGDEREAVRRLAAEGPPEEEVGLAPFAPPEYMPEPDAGPPLPADALRRSPP